jgi:hypothetical protein
MELAEQSPTSSAADVNKLSCAIHPIPKSLQEQLPCSPHDAYFHLAHWHPISTAPCNQSLELRVAEGHDIVTVQFPCCRTNDNEWINADLGTQVHLNPVQWRIWKHSKRPHPHRSQV